MTKTQNPKEREREKTVKVLNSFYGRGVREPRRERRVCVWMFL